MHKSPNVRPFANQPISTSYRKNLMNNLENDHNFNWKNRIELKANNKPNNKLYTENVKVK